MGLLDIPGILFSWIDRPLAALLPDLARIVLWSAAAGIGCMLLYGVASRQEAIRRLKAESRAARARLAAYDGDFPGMLDLVRANLRLSLRQVGLTLGPAVVASLPLLVVAVWMSGAFGYRLPVEGQPVQVVAFDSPPNAEAGPGAQRWRIAWSGDGIVPITGPEGRRLGALAPDRLSPVLHPKRWWNFLIGNPAGYLPEETPIREVRIALAPARYLPAVPSWMAGWEFLFLLCATLASLATKFARRIQ